MLLGSRLGWQRRAPGLLPGPAARPASKPWAALRQQRRHQQRQPRPQRQPPTAASETEPQEAAEPGTGEQLEPADSAAAKEAAPPRRPQACTSAAQLLHLVEARLDAGDDDERLAVGVLQRACMLRHSPGFIQSETELDTLLPALERLLRRNLVAFTPDQLGTAARCYVLLGGASPLVLGALQEEACNWGPHDYSLRPLSELVWSLAWAKRAPAPAFLAHTQDLVEEQGRDWRGWFAGARAGRLVMVLWGLASLRVQPCEPFLEAACGRVAEVPLARVPSKSLVTLLWALARLQSADVPAVEAISGELSARMEQQLLEDGPAGQRGTLESSWEEGNAPSPSQDEGWEEGGPAAAQEGGEEEEGAEWPGLGRSSALSGRNGAAVAAGGHSGGKTGWEATAGGGGLGASWETELSPGLLSTLVWAWGKLRHRSGAGMRMAALLLQGSVRELAPEDISRVLWGLAALEYGQSQQLLGALGAHLQQPGVLSAFAIPQLATTLYAFSALDHFPGEPLLDLIADSCLAAGESSFDPRSLCHMLWSMARLGYSHEAFYLHFVPVILPDIEQYSPAELADLSRVYAKLGLEPEGLFEAIAQQTVAQMQSADIQDLLRILTAFNQLGLQPDALLAAVEVWADQRLRQLSPQALTLALGTFARLGVPRSPSLMASAAECVTGQLDRFEPAQLALVAWSFAKLDYRATQVLDYAAAQLVASTASFNDKAVSNVLWALATMRHPLAHAVRDLDTIAAGTQGRLKGFGAQSLSNIAWAYATLAHKPSPQFLDALGDAAKGQLRAFEPQGLSLLVWALASLGHRHEPLLQGIDAYCSRGDRLRGFEGQQLSNLLWGMAKVGFRPGPAFWKQCAQEAALQAPELGSQELFNVAWAFATLRLHPPRLISVLAAEAARRPFALSPQELSGLLWALGRLRHGRGVGAAALLAASETELERRAGEFEDRHLAVTVWAWGELRHAPGPRALGALWRELGQRAGGLGAQALCTLFKGCALLGSAPSAPLMAALAARANRLSPEFKGFECAELLESWLALGLRAEAAQLLQHLAATPAAATKSSGRSGGGEGSSSGSGRGGRRDGRSLLDAVVATAPLPSLARLLAAMGQLDFYPEPAFSMVCKRLGAASTTYRFSQRDLQSLAKALESADDAHKGRIRLQPWLLQRVAAATAPAEAAGAAARAGAAGGAQGPTEEEGAGAATPSRHGWFPPDHADLLL